MLAVLHPALSVVYQELCYSDELHKHLVENALGFHLPIHTNANIGKGPPLICELFYVKRQA